MKRTFSEFATFLAVLLLPALYWMSGWQVATSPERPFPDGVLAVLALVAGALILYLTSDRALNEMSPVAPLAYLVLATVQPASLYVSPLHGAAVLLAASLYFHLNYCAAHPTLGNLAGAGLTLGGASLFFPPLLWLAPVYASTAFGRSEDKLKFGVTALLCLLLPLGAYVGVESILGNGPADILPGYWAQMIQVTTPTIHYSVATLCRILLTLVVALVAIVQLLGRLNRYRTAQYRAVIRLVLLSLAIGLLALLFLSDGRLPAALITALPVSLLLNDCLCETEHRKRGMITLLIILLLVLIAERITYFV